LNGYTANSFLVELYDYVVPYRDRQDVNFFVEMAQSSGGPVLEVGCETGRVLIPMAKAGVEIVGLNIDVQRPEQRLSGYQSFERLCKYLRA